MRRLHSLDALRGVAALAVVFWHWQHFFALDGVWLKGWRPQAEPLYWLFKPLYDHGWAAVDLFFPLSGYIFFRFYADAVRDRRVGTGAFALLRISRLYPLHTATLIAAAVLQLAFHSKTGHWFIYSDNDWSHFATSLLMAQQWLPPTLDQCFNGPAWSVSIEVLLYAIFFLVVRAGFGGWRPALAIAVFSIPLIFWNEFIARGLMGFFVGGVAFHLEAAIRKRADAHRIAQVLGIAALAVWIFIAVESYSSPTHSLLAQIAGSGAKNEHYADTVGWVFRLMFTFVASPLTIVALSLDEQLLGGRYDGLSPLGDISYSTYLFHIPLQMCLALSALAFGIDWHIFMSPFAMMGFFAILVGLGTASFHFFERPLQLYLRSVGGPKLVRA